MSKCIRCEKYKGDIHTCSPSKNWRKAMDEGIEISRQLILEKGSNAIFSVNVFSTQIARELKERKSKNNE